MRLRGAIASTRGACAPQIKHRAEAASRETPRQSEAATTKMPRMKRIGMILLGLYLLVDSLLGFGLNLGPAIFLLYLIGLVAGALIVFDAAVKSD
ncbi:MAG: hypothetical protein ACRD4P_18560 [Bryobacteraceae bacterium]